MSDVKSPTKIWDGQYAVRVEIFENEFVYLQEDMEYASMWNTGKAVRYDPVGEV